MPYPEDDVYQRGLFMNKARFVMISLTLGVILIGLFSVIVAQEPIAAQGLATQAPTLVFQANPNSLHPCGYYKEVLTFHTPDPVKAAPTKTANTSGATPTK